MSDQLHDAMVRPHGPSLRNRDKEMIPKTLLRAMFGLALAALAIVSFAVITDRKTVGQPKPVEILQSRTLVIEGRGPDAVLVTEPGGAIVADLANGGFVAVVGNGLNRARLVKGIPGNPPVDLVAYANGRLALHDPASAGEE